MIDCQVLKLPKKAFNNLMDANTDFRKDILSIARDREVIRLH
jgi:CRP-like cAMP-binding protein